MSTDITKFFVLEITGGRTLNVLASSVYIFIVVLRLAVQLMPLS